MPLFNELPDELLILIFDKLSVKQRIRYLSVCRLWYRLLPLRSHRLRLDMYFNGIVYINSNPKMLTVDAKRVYCNQTAASFIRQAGCVLKELRVDYQPINKIFSDKVYEFCFQPPLEQILMPDIDTTRIAHAADRNMNELWVFQSLMNAQELSAVVDKTIPKEVNPKDDWVCKLIEHCSNLVSLKLMNQLQVDVNTLSGLMKHVGVQLETFCFLPNDATLKIDQITADIILPNLNAVRLRKLAIRVHKSSILDLVCDEFPWISNLGLFCDKETSVPDLRYLTQLKDLQSLSLHLSPETDVFDLSFLPVEHLIHTLFKLKLRLRLHCKDLAPIEKLQQLKNLKTWITAESQVNFIFEHLTQLKSLNLCFQTPALRPMKAMLKLVRMKQLQSLVIDGREFASSLLLHQLAPMESIQHFTLGREICLTKKFHLNSFFHRLAPTFPNLLSLRIYERIVERESLCRTIEKCVSQLAKLKMLTLNVDENGQFFQIFSKKFCHHRGITFLLPFKKVKAL